MKIKVILLSVMFLLILSSVTLVSGRMDYYDVDVPVINVVAETITPYPVEPGFDFTVQLRVSNDGGVSADSVSVDFLKSDTFFLTGVETDFNTPFSLGAGSSKDNTFYFTVLPDVISGEYPLIFEVESEGMIHKEIVNVRIIGKPDVIFSAELNGSVIVPGKVAFAKIYFTNVGTGIARKIKIVPLTEDMVMENENLLFIESIKPNETLERDLEFMVEDNLEPGPKKLFFDIYYADELGSDYVYSQSLGYMLENIVQLDISSLSLEPAVFKKGEEGTFTLRIENLGEGSAKDVRVNLFTEDFAGNKAAFLGMVDEDEDAPAIFRLTGKTSGIKEIPIQISYKDDYGVKELNETIIIEVENDNTLFLAFGALIIIAIFLVGYFKYKNEKANEA